MKIIHSFSSLKNFLKFTKNRPLSKNPFFKKLKNIFGYKKTIAICLLTGTHLLYNTFIDNDLMLTYKDCEESR